MRRLGYSRLVIGLAVCAVLIGAVASWARFSLSPGLTATPKRSTTLERVSAAGFLRRLNVGRLSSNPFSNRKSSVARFTLNGGKLYTTDSRLDHADAVFSSLQLWQDTNRNGVSEPSELKTLASVGLSAIDLDYKDASRRDQAGNQFRYRAKVTDTQGRQLGRWAWDVILVSRL